MGNTKLAWITCQIRKRDHDLHKTRQCMMLTAVFPLWPGDHSETKTNINIVARHPEEKYSYLKVRVNKSIVTYSAHSREVIFLGQNFTQTDINAFVILPPLFWVTVSSRPSNLAWLGSLSLRTDATEDWFCLPRWGQKMPSENLKYTRNLLTMTINLIYILTKFVEQKIEVEGLLEGQLWLRFY